MEKFITIFAKDVPVNTDKGNTVIKTVGPNDNNTLVDSVQGIINAIIAVLGIVAVLVIILGGVQYMTSSGDSAKVKKAKDTILYGVIGLIICVLAFAIVNFVIMNIIGGE